MIDSPEVLEVLHEIPHLEDYLQSLYNGDYAKFFVALAALETSAMKQSWVLFPHYRYYVREMRIRGYAQLLESYRSLTMQSMAHSFGVSEEFIDRYGLVTTFSLFLCIMPGNNCSNCCYIMREIGTCQNSSLQGA